MEQKNVVGGVYDVKKYSFYNGNCYGAKCGYCGCEYLSPFGWNGLFGKQYAREKAYACQLIDEPTWEKFGWEPAGDLSF